MTISSTSNLQLTHLRFDCIATTPIKLGGHRAGNSLRNALANVIYRAVCPEGRRRGDPPSSSHAATCPACWLLSANIEPGTVIRAYTIVPPIPTLWDLQAGDSFSFGLTLFGEGYNYLPYFVLAISEMGRSEGLGPGRRGGLGRFDLTAISAIDPLRGDCKLMLRPGETVVSLPEQQLDWTAVSKISQHHLQNLPNSTLTFHFLTPVRLEEKKHLYKIPDFSVLFRRLLYRIDELNRQFAGQPRRERDDVIRLTNIANQVKLVDADVKWHEIWSRSGRKKSKTPLSGFTGTAVYYSDSWESLMPWLVLGQATQLGKSTAKGNGVYELISAEWPPYWDWLRLSYDELFA